MAGELYRHLESIHQELHGVWLWWCWFHIPPALGLLDYQAEDILRRSEGKQKTYKSSGQKQKYILTLTLTGVSLKSMCFHTATYRSFLSFCDRDGRQRSIPSDPFWQIEWREWNLLFLEGLPCGNRVTPIDSEGDTGAGMWCAVFNE